MSQKIKVLSENIANMIAAGEVVERPASVAKELIENAIDAGSDRIEISCRGSGKRFIRVLDNGEGMTHKDALICLERHATSKIRNENDLKSIQTLGFRGEALPSIASVSEMILTTRPVSETSATRIILKAGVIKEVSKAGSPVGTIVEVRHLFSNIPARAKFLRSAQTELSHIVQTVIRQSIPRHNTSFKLSNDEHTLLHLTQCKDLSQRFCQIVGQELMDRMIEVKGERDGIKIYGFISKTGLNRSNLFGQYLYVNKRFIKSPIIQKAIHRAYQPHLPHQRYPVFCLLLDINPERVDFNVHPTKLEIRFDQPSKIVDLISTLVQESIRLPMEWSHTPSKLKDIRTSDSDLSAVPQPKPIDYKGSSIAFVPKKQTGQIPLIKQTDKEGYSSGHPPLKETEFESFHPDPVKEDARQALMPLGPCMQIDHSYILYETMEGIVIIDQHAAHERINFERIRSSMLDKNTPSQKLLTHSLISVSAEEDVLMDQVIPVLNDLGFNIEPFGTRTYILRGVPVFLNSDPAQAIQAIIQKLLEHRSIKEMAQLIDPISATMACHLSVKAHQSLKPQEIHQLIDDLLATEHPYSCPHGRPTLFRISKKDIEKNFGR